MMLADVDAGTDTPSFVSRVLSFRKENRTEGQRLWDGLERSNESVAEAIAGLVRLEESESEVFDEALRRAAKQKIDEVSDCRLPAIEGVRGILSVAVVGAYVVETGYKSRAVRAAVERAW
jgi:hypothetical protein